jgi:pre-mRNA-splicing factor SPF27
MADHNDVLDSLPYYDDDLQKYPFLKDKVEQEIARELGKVPTALHPRVPPEVELFTVRKRDAKRVQKSLLRGVNTE